MKKIREEIAAKEVGFFVFVIHGVVLAQVPTCRVAAACTDRVGHVQPRVVLRSRHRTSSMRSHV